MSRPVLLPAAAHFMRIMAQKIECRGPARLRLCRCGYAL